MTLKEAKQNYLKTIEEIQDREDWQWALNELRDETSEKFFKAIQQILDLIED